MHIRGGRGEKRVKRPEVEQLPFRDGFLRYFLVGVVVVVVAAVVVVAVVVCSLSKLSSRRRVCVCVWTKIGGKNQRRRRARTLACLASTGNMFGKPKGSLFCLQGAHATYVGSTMRGSTSSRSTWPVRLREQQLLASHTLNDGLSSTE